MNKLRLWVALVAMSSSPFLFAQGGGGSTHDHNSCVPITITGERNPVPGETETYTHSFAAHAGEPFTWEVEGAFAVDGVPTNGVSPFTTTKSGGSLDVVWDESPVGRIKAVPVNPCAVLAQAGGLGGVVVTKGLCDDPVISLYFLPKLNTYEWLAFNPYVFEQVASNLLPYHTYHYVVKKPNGNNDFCGGSDIVWKIKNAYSVDGVIVNSLYYTITTNQEIDIEFKNTADVKIEVKTVDNCGTFGACGKRSATTYPLVRTIPNAHYVGKDADGFPIFDVDIPFMCDNATPVSITIPSAQVLATLWLPTYPSGIYSNSLFGTFTQSVVPQRDVDYGVQLIYEDHAKVTLMANLINTNPIVSDGEDVIITSQPCASTGSELYGLSKPRIGGFGATTIEAEILSGNGQFVNTSTGKTYAGAWNQMEIQASIGAITIRSRELLGACGETAWKTQEIATRQKMLPTPITDMELVSGRLCQPNDILELTTTTSATHEEYVWSYTSGYAIGQFLDGGVTTANSNRWQASIINTGSTVVVPIHVRARNACGTSSVFTKNISMNPNNTLLPVLSPGIIEPANYCPGVNTFEAGFQIANVEYCWRLTNVFDHETNNISTSYSMECGINKTTYSPDFGYDEPDNGRIVQGLHTNGRGNIASCNVELFLRDCSATSFTTIKPISNIVYSGCGGSPPSIGTGGNPNANAMAIQLVPNPASDQVTVHITDAASQAAISITDAYGTERKHVVTNSTQETIMIQDLPLGVYHVIVTSGSDVAAEHLQILP